MLKTYYCVASCGYADNDSEVLSEWPKHDELEWAEKELFNLGLDPNLFKIYKVTYEIEEINA